MLKGFRRFAGYAVCSYAVAGLLGCVNPPKRSSAVRPAVTQPPNDSGGDLPEFPPSNGARTGNGDTNGAGNGAAPATGAASVVVEYWLNSTKSNNCLTIQVADESPISAPCTASVTPSPQWVTREYGALGGTPVSSKVTIETTDFNGTKFVVPSENPGSQAWRMRCASAPTATPDVFENVLCYEDGDEATLRGGNDSPQFESSDLNVRIRGPRMSRFGAIECESVTSINMASCMGQ